MEKKMHYPVMTERQLAFRWKISLKTLRRGDVLFFVCGAVSESVLVSFSVVRG